MNQDSSTDIKITYHPNGITGDCEISTTPQKAKDWNPKIKSRFGITDEMIQITQTKEQATIKFEASFDDLMDFELDIEVALSLDSSN